MTDEQIESAVMHAIDRAVKDHSNIWLSRAALLAAAKDAIAAYELLQAEHRKKEAKLP